MTPLLPNEPAKPKGGLARCGDRDALRGIVFVLSSGTPWETLPREAAERRVADPEPIMMVEAFDRIEAAAETDPILSISTEAA